MRDIWRSSNKDVVQERYREPEKLSPVITEWHRISGVMATPPTSGTDGDGRPINLIVRCIRPKPYCLLGRQGINGWICGPIAGFPAVEVPEGAGNSPGRYHHRDSEPNWRTAVLPRAAIRPIRDMTAVSCRRWSAL